MNLEALVLRLAKENRDWGYRRIQGALSNPGYNIARGTIAEILERHGIKPAPERCRKKTTWKEFLSRHWELIVSARWSITPAIGRWRPDLFFRTLRHTRTRSKSISCRDSGVYYGPSEDSRWKSQMNTGGLVA